VIQDVAADVNNADVLMQVVQVEQVDGVTVELLDVVAGTLKSPTTTNLQSSSTSWSKRSES